MRSTPVKRQASRRRSGAGRAWRDHGGRQRPRHAAGDGHGHPRLLEPRLQPRGVCGTGPRRPGQALKTILAMPFVLDGEAGRVEICARGLCHQIEFAVDALRQAPVIRHRHEERDVRKGTSITVAWPNSACSILAGAEQRFLQIADDYTWLNPHLALTVTWFGERSAIRATDPAWQSGGRRTPPARTGTRPSISSA